MRPCSLWVGSFLAIVLAIGASLARADTPPDGLPTASHAVAGATPAIPPELVSAMQEARYAEALSALDALEKNTTDPDTRAYLSLVRGIALRLARRFDDARAVLSKAIQARPKGPWAAKLRAELAAVLLAGGKVSEAEALARSEVETLLASDRKDRLTEVYRAFAVRLIRPDDPFGRRNLDDAHNLLVQARTLARGKPLRARLLFEAANASRELGQNPQAVAEYEEYLKTYPDGADRSACRFFLGLSQFVLSQHLNARLTWSDLARAPETPSDFRIRSLYLIARTYTEPDASPKSRGGFQSVAPVGPETPTPLEQEAMPPAEAANYSLQIAALKRVLTSNPEHPLAVKAAYEIGEIARARGWNEEALQAFRAFLRGEGYQATTDEAKRTRDRLILRAAFEVGEVLASEGLYAEAIAAWKDQLTRFPNAPGSADAQRAILKAQLDSAQELARNKKFAEARAVWKTFLAENPLDERAPQVSYQIAETLRDEGKFDDAITALEALIGRFGTGEAVEHARYLLGLIQEENKGAPEQALEQYRKVADSIWKNQARSRITIMEARLMRVVTPRTFRTSEVAHLQISTRNLERLSFSTYKLDPEAFFRKKQALNGVEALDISLVAPDLEWTESVPGYAKYKTIETNYDLKRLTEPGFWAVKVSDEKSFQATTMVLRSDIEAVVRASRDQTLVFVQDMRSGKGRAGARVLVADGKETFLEARTGADGVVLKDWPGPRDASSSLAYLVLDGPEAAGSSLALPGTIAQGMTPRAYLYTDRPAYRPGQPVNLRGVVREVENGRYAFHEGAHCTLEVTDSRGRRIVSREIKLSQFGTFHELLTLAEGAPVGAYVIKLSTPAKSEFTGKFEVQAYELEKADLRIELARTVVYRGETVKLDVIARYQYGSPLVGRDVSVALPDGRTLKKTTDSAGKISLEFPTEGFAEEGSLRITAQLPEEGVSASANVMLAVRAFGIDLETNRAEYLSGESFPLRASTLDALGEPTGQALTVSVIKSLGSSQWSGKREVSSTKLSTDPKTGRGEVTLSVTDEEGGSYILRVSGTDRFGNAIAEDREIRISSPKDALKLRILADRQSYKVGESARVNLHNHAGAGLALLSWEADRILIYRLIEVAPGDNAVSWEVDGEQFPNFTLAASRMETTRLDEARLDVCVQRDLVVTLKPVKPRVGPGEEIALDALDHRPAWPTCCGRALAGTGRPRLAATSCRQAPAYRSVLPRPHPSWGLCRHCHQWVSLRPKDPDNCCRPNAGITDSWCASCYEREGCATTQPAGQSPHLSQRPQWQDQRRRDSGDHQSARDAARDELPHGDVDRGRFQVHPERNNEPRPAVGNPALRGSHRASGSREDTVIDDHDRARRHSSPKDTRRGAQAARNDLRDSGRALDCHLAI